MSSEPKWTPGPWHHSDGNTYFQKTGKLMTGDLILGPEMWAGDWIAAVWQNENVTIQEANARLIAAAPDLYNALDVLLGEVQDDSLDCVKQAKAALARARGEPPYPNCKQPKQCAALGYCPLEISCSE